MNKKFLYAVATLVGTIIGAGVLSIPYVFAQAGFITGLINLAVLGTAVIILYLYLGEVVLRTKGNHQLTGYAFMYLGKAGERLMALSMIFGIYGALIAYIIGEGPSIAALFNIDLPFLFSLAFFLVMALLVYRGLKSIAKSELVLSSLVIIIILIISGLALTRVDLSNLAEFSFRMIFVPYGVVLFALAGAVAIPEMKEIMTHDRKNLKKAIIAGAIIPTVLYLLFALTVVAASGPDTTEVATIGLGQALGQSMVIFGNLFAIFAMATSFLALALALKEMYDYDYKMHETVAWILTVLPPLFFFLFVSKSFVGVIGITGGIAMGLEGILLVLMYHKAKKMGKRKPEYKINISPVFSVLLVIIFIIGMIYTIAQSLGLITI